jgi:hypothetical protein
MLHDLDLYKEYYERFPKRAQAQWALIFSDDPAERQALEEILKMTQAAAVDDFIETSCWKDDLPDLAGNKGTADERLHRLRFVYLLQHSKLTTLTEYRLLTPLEHDLVDLVEEMEKSCTIDKLKKRAQSVMKDADRVADRAKRRWWKEMEVQREKEDVPFAAVIDATAAETLEEFASIVEKDSPEIADAIKRDIAAKKKKKAAGKRRKK